MNLGDRAAREAQRHPEDWRARGRAGNIERMAKAMVDFMATAHGGPSWDKLSESDKGVAAAMAAAAYDAL